LNKELKKLFKNQRIKSFSKGNILIYEGDQVKKIYYIISGFVKVYTVVNTNEQRIIYIYKPGDIFPLTTYLSGSHTARFFYESMNPATMRCISIKKFEQKVEGNYELGEALVQYTNNIDKQFLRRVNDIVSRGDDLSKVISLLNFLYQKFGTDQSQTNIILPLTPMELSCMCSLSRDETLKQLRKFKTAGVNYNSSSIIIDTAAFRKLKSKNFTL
jgi:CRP-like cAMP-binding protein